MRSALIALILVFIAGAASAQMPNLSDKVEALKPNINVNIPKPMTKDTVLEATLVEEGGEFFLDVRLYLPQQYPPHELHVTVYEGPAKDGPWSRIVPIPRSLVSPVQGDNTMHIPLTKAPEVGFMRVSLNRVEGSQGQPPHAEKIFEVYCTGVQVKN